MGFSSFICPFLSIGIICSSSGVCDSISPEKISVSNCERAFDETGTNYVSISLTEQQQESYAILERISELPSNWNGNNAEPFSSELIDICRRYIQFLPAQPEIFPTAVGAIQFEYRKDDGSYLEFEVYEDTVKEYRVFPNGEEIEKYLFNIGEMKKEVDSFYE